MGDDIGERPRMPTENDPASKPRADVLTSKAVTGDTAYLVRLREDWNTRTTYHIKKFADFVALDEKLKIDKEKMGDMHPIATLPELPAQGSRFGIRRQLSKLGAGNFLNNQHEHLQRYVDIIISQIPNLSADANLQYFFSDTEAGPLDKELCKQMVLEVKGGLNLSILRGYWKIENTDRIWSIDESGRALLDGRHRGADYDLKEHGAGIEVVIDRPDGWGVDLDKSSREHLVWSKAGQEDLHWMRELDARAEETLKKVEERRLDIAAAGAS